MLRVKETKVKDRAAKKIILEAMGIEPATLDMKSRLATNSTVLTVIPWSVFVL